MNDTSNDGANSYTYNDYQVTITNTAGGLLDRFSLKIITPDGIQHELQDVFTSADDAKKAAHAHITRHKLEAIIRGPQQRAIPIEREGRLPKKPVEPDVERQNRAADWLRRWRNPKSTD